MLIEDLATGRWYHGTTKPGAGESILSSGEIRPGNTGTTSRRLQQPIPGRTYLSRSIKMAAIYSLGGVVMGTDPWPSAESSQFGYLFVVNSLPEGAFPDEDLVGEWITYRNDELSRGHPNLANAMRNVRPYLGQTHLRRAMQGEYAYCASIGKAALGMMQKGRGGWMTPALIDRLAMVASEVSVAGAVRWDEAWRVDRLRSREVSRDGSNLLEISTRVA